MPHVRLRLAAALCCAALALLAGAAGAALVEIGDLVVRADGGFTPRVLPRNRYAPIEFQGHFDIGSKSGGRPAALKQVVIEFDRDGKLDPTGLPTCSAESVAELTVEEARALCRGAIVGTGHIEAAIALNSGLVHAQSPLTLFNAPPIEGSPAVVLHARTTSPGIQVFAIPIPIERRPGAFRYRATLNLPPIAAGLGAIIHVDVQIGRRFRAGGRSRSYVSARCTDSVLETRGRFSFDDGTAVKGSVEKFCRIK